MDQHTEPMELYQKGNEAIWLIPTVAAVYYPDWTLVPRETEQSRRKGDE